MTSCAPKAVFLRDNSITLKVSRRRRGVRQASMFTSLYGFILVEQPEVHKAGQPICHCTQKGITGLPVRKHHLWGCSAIRHVGYSTEREFVNGCHTFTLSSKMKRASLQDFERSVKDAWLTIPSSMVIKDFKKWEISNAIDGIKVRCFGMLTATRSNDNFASQVGHASEVITLYFIMSSCNKSCLCQVKSFFYQASKYGIHYNWRHCTFFSDREKRVCILIEGTLE